MPQIIRARFGEIEIAPLVFPMISIEARPMNRIGASLMEIIGNKFWTRGIGRFNLQFEEKIMAYVIAEPCIGVKDKACVEVCPFDAIHGGDDDAQMFINPDECTSCGACEPECPVEAIYDQSELPAKWKHYIEINAAHFD